MTRVARRNRGFQVYVRRGSGLLVASDRESEILISGQQVLRYRPPRASPALAALARSSRIPAVHVEDFGHTVEGMADQAADCMVHEPLSLVA
jgi:hypothetical protein